MVDYDVIIVGAGVVGPPLSVALARQGRRVLVVERDLSEPNRIVGELLQPGGVRALKLLGMESATEGIDAVPVHGYEIFLRGKAKNIPYPLIEGSKAGERAQGRSFHHGKFIMSLRSFMYKEPNVTVLEATVTDVVSDDQGRITGVKTKSKDGVYTTHTAALTVVADGTTSKFRKDFTSRKPVVKSNFVGMVLQDAVMPAPYHGHVILGDHAPILVYQIGTHETRILCDIRGSSMPSIASGEMKAYLLDNVLPAVPEPLQPSVKTAILEGKFRSMPNQFLPTSPNRSPGLVLLGDAWNMRHPLTGGGMTVALNDVYLLSTHLARVPDLADWALVKAELDQIYWERKGLASVINILAQALYALFAADSADLRILQRGCFAYFERGGECVNGPVSLLSGVLPRPALLVYHFFAVAFYAIRCNFVDQGWRGAPLALVQVFTVLYTATVVIAPFMVEEAKWY